MAVSKVKKDGFASIIQHGWEVLEFTQICDSWMTVCLTAWKQLQNGPSAEIVLSTIHVITFAYNL